MRLSRHFIASGIAIGDSRILDDRIPQYGLLIDLALCPCRPRGSASSEQRS